MKVVYRMANGAEVANGSVHVRVVPTHGEELVIHHEPGTAVSVEPKYPWKTHESKDEAPSEEGAPVAHAQLVESLYAERDALRSALSDMQVELDRLRVFRDCVYEEIGESINTSEHDALGRLRRSLGSNMRLTAELSDMTAERDAALAKAEHYARDWYAAKIEFGDAAAKLRAQVRDLESRALDVAMALRGLLSNPHVGRKSAEGYATDVRAEIGRLRARVRELEAPPVVPRDYRVEQAPGQPVVWLLFYGDIDGGDVVLEAGGGTLTTTDPTLGIDPAAVRALIWSAEHGKRPPHEADDGNEVECG